MRAPGVVIPSSPHVPIFLYSVAFISDAWEQASTLVSPEPSMHGANSKRRIFISRARMQGGPGGPGGRGEPERGQGYRKLWQQVTKVGRGQKLGEGAEAVPFSDMTVEDLLRIVRSLPPEESAVAAVSRGLFYLDSRALAALLKELHKVGLSNRCVHMQNPPQCPWPSFVTNCPFQEGCLDVASCLAMHQARWTAPINLQLATDCMLHLP